MVQQKKQKKIHTGGNAWFIIGGVAYVGFLLLFAWQTGSFVNWLFPNDQIVWKVLTVVCFDGMALFWACVETFYKFAVKGARTLVQWAWVISFILSFVASIFYMVIESMFRFQVIVTPEMVNVGYGIVIFAIVLQVLFLTFWMRMEWMERHPIEDEYEESAQQPVQAPPQPAAPPALDMAALLSAMQHMASDAAQNAANAATKQLMDTLTLPAPQLPPARPKAKEAEYVVNKPKEPVTEQLAPFQAAPKPSGNGAK